MAFDQHLLKDLPVSIIDGDRGKAYPKRSEFTNSGHCLFLNAGNVTSTGFDFRNHIQSSSDYRQSVGLTSFRLPAVVLAKQ